MSNMITVATKKQGASLTETSLTKNLKKQTSTKQTHCTAIPFLNRPATTPRTNGEDDDKAKAKAVTATKGIKSPEAAVAWETIKEIAVAGNANDKASFPKRKVSLSPEPSDGNKDRSPYKNDHPSRRADVSGIGAQDAPQHGSHSRSLKKPINYYKEDSSDDGSIFSLSSSSQRITDNNVLIVDDRKPTAVPTPPTKTNRVPNFFEATVKKNDDENKIKNKIENCDDNNSSNHCMPCGTSGSVYEGDRKFRCSWKGCGKSYKVQKSLNTHFRVNHPTKDDGSCSEHGILQTRGRLPSAKNLPRSVRKFCCSWKGCGKSYKDQKTLNTHFRANHPTKDDGSCSEHGILPILRHFPSAKNLIEKKKWEGLLTQTLQCIEEAGVPAMGTPPKVWILLCDHVCNTVAQPYSLKVPMGRSRYYIFKNIILEMWGALEAQTKNPFHELAMGQHNRHKRERYVKSLEEKK